MKRFLAFLLALAMVFSSFTTVWASEKRKIPFSKTITVINLTPAVQAKTAESDDVIEENKVPLASAPTLYTWAFINLLCVLITAILAAGLMVCGIINHLFDIREKRHKHRFIIRIGAIVITLVGVILFCLTEDMSQPVVFADRYTIVMVLIAVAQILITVASYREEIKDNRRDDEKELE